jgi:LytS/YehU family sensor histidine kinase
VWSLIYDASISQRNKSLNELKQLQLENNMKKIQLDSLAGKIDPHFIFNALNNIRSLIREDSEKARSAILILSDILRSPIAKTYHEKIPVIEEMLLVRSYIALSKLQFEHRLNYQETLHQQAKTALIPPMMLQILVENAIKHGISQLPGGGNLNVDIDADNRTLICRVSNDGKLNHKSNAPGFGIGIENIKERIALYYAGKAQFTLSENQQTVIAELRLPLEYYENKEKKL